MVHVQQKKTVTDSMRSTSFKSTFIETCLDVRIFFHFGGNFHSVNLRNILNCRPKIFHQRQGVLHFYFHFLLIIVRPRTTILIVDYHQLFYECCKLNFAAKDASDNS